jgi:hypothetical protein
MACGDCLKLHCVYCTFVCYFRVYLWNSSRSSPCLCIFIAGEEQAHLIRHTGRNVQEGGRETEAKF